MADISITPANFDPDDGYTYRDYIAGATITAGQALYIDSSDSNKAKTALTTNAATANCVGLAMHAASANQPIRVMTGGVVTIGGTSAAGQPYTLSDNAGGLAAAADNGSGDYVTVIAVGLSTTKIKLGINVSATAHA